MNIYDVTLVVFDDQLLSSSVTHQIGVFPASFTEEPAGWMRGFGNEILWEFILMVSVFVFVMFAVYARAKKGKWFWEP